MAYTSSHSSFLASFTQLLSRICYGEWHPSNAQIKMGSGEPSLSDVPPKMYLLSTKDSLPVGLKGVFKFQKPFLHHNFICFSHYFVIKMLDTPLQPAVGERLILKTDFRQTICTLSMDVTKVISKKNFPTMLRNYMDTSNHAWDYETRQNIQAN